MAVSILESWKTGSLMGLLKSALVLAVGFALIAGAAEAAKCSSTGAGFENWKPDFAAEAKAHGVKPRAISALMSTSYSKGTIRADRGQHNFELSLNAFMAKRGASGIIARGRSLKKANAALFAALEKRYGVPPGPLLAIWGMETGFHRQPEYAVGGGNAGL
jgi:membrane-bound lytic murein transglycosylase B